MSAKITIREADGTEYQVKKRIAEMILAAGYSRKVKRGLHEMIRVTVSYALRTVVRDWESGDLKPEGPPECTVYSYPVRERTSNAKPFGFYQNWDEFA